MPQEKSRLYVLDSKIDGRGGILWPDGFPTANKLLRDCVISSSHFSLPLYIPKDMTELRGYHEQYGELGWARFNYKNQILMMTDSDCDQITLLKMILQGGIRLDKPFIEIVKTAFEKVNNLYVPKPLRKRKNH